jgi:hypothetical protein
MGVRFADGEPGGDGGAGGGVALSVQEPAKSDEGKPEQLPTETQGVPSADDIKLLGLDKPAEKPEKKGEEKPPVGTFVASSLPPQAPPTTTSPQPVLAQASPTLASEVKDILAQLPGKIAEGLRPKDEAKAPTPRQFFRFEVKPEDMDRFLGDPAKGAEFLNSKINEGLQKVREEMAETIGHWVEDQFKDFEEKKFKPVAESSAQYKQQQAEAGRQQVIEVFKARHPDLADATDIVEEIAKQVLSSPNPIQYKTYEEFYDDMAARARPVIEELRKRWGGGTATTKVARSAPPPAASAPAARPPAASGGANGGSKTQDQIDFEAMRAI